MKIHHYIPDDTNLNGFLQTGPSKYISLYSSTIITGYPPENILNQDETYLHTAYNDTNPWLIIGIEDNYFYLESYTVKTRDMKFDIDLHPKQWILECSMDNNTYYQIDEQNTNELFGESLKKRFNVKSPNICKYFRFNNWITEEDHHKIVIGSLDFFGYFIHSSVFTIFSHIHQINFPIKHLAYIFLLS